MQNSRCKYLLYVYLDLPHMMGSRKRLISTAALTLPFKTSTARGNAASIPSKAVRSVWHSVVDSIACQMIVGYVIVQATAVEKTVATRGIGKSIQKSCHRRHVRIARMMQSMWLADRGFTLSDVNSA
jgi:hypothetical protein